MPGLPLLLSHHSVPTPPPPVSAISAAVGPIHASLGFTHLSVGSSVDRWTVVSSRIGMDITLGDSADYWTTGDSTT